MKAWLLDAGPLIAYLNPADPAHHQCAEPLENFTGSLFTTGAVVAEVLYFMLRHANGPALFLEFVETSGTKVIECCQLEDLRNAVGLMTRYSDVPMDFADATLVLLAEALDQTHICTLDRRGFSTFRTPSGKHFHLVISL